MFFMRFFRCQLMTEPVGGQNTFLTLVPYLLLHKCHEKTVQLKSVGIVVFDITVALLITISIDRHCETLTRIKA